jgi:glycosyltransferase involved in cell wall biosynthesis
MRIGFVSPHYAPYKGGVETLVQAIAERLALWGHQVEVLTLDNTGTLPVQEEINQVMVRRFRERVPGDVYHVGLPMFFYLLAHREDYDVVNAHNYHALPLLWASITHSKHLVASTHYHGGGHGGLANLIHPVYRPFGRWALGRARKVICASEFERELVQAHLQVGQEKSVIVSDGIDLGALRAAQPLEHHSPALLYVGRLEKYKRVDLTIACLTHLPEDFWLYIIGKGREEDILKKQATQLKVDDRVVFLKDVEDEMLYRWYRSASVLVMMSEAESFPMTSIEAIAAGCRVVCGAWSPFTELAKQIPEAIFPLQDPTPATIADEIQRIANLPGRPEVELRPYDWNTIAHETLEIFEGVF